MKSMRRVNLKNITPGEILLEDYMKPMGLSQNALARALDVPPRRVNEIIHGKRAITLDTSLRLARYFGQSPRFWLNIQNERDLRNAQKLQERIFQQIRPCVAA
jgi:addiction module HigA family antidote